MKQTATIAGTEIWDRLWCHVPSVEKDRASIERERRCPRWLRFRERLIAQFGQLTGLRTLELGSGRGDMSLLLAQEGAHVTLMDLSMKVLDQARRRFEGFGLEAEYVRADLLALPDAFRAKFDVSFSLGVVEHFRGSDRTRAIAPHAQALRPGGLTMISVPHAACLSYRLWKAYLELRGWWPYGMEIPYWKGELRRRAVEVGLTPVEHYAYGWWQSLGDHWVKGVLRRNCDWSTRRSVLDQSMGGVLVMIACR
jgi:SAM-dependent methyltransferase